MPIPAPLRNESQRRARSSRQNSADERAPAATLCARLAAGANDGSRAHDLPRALIVVAHPDDEIIGVGGRMHRLHSVAIVHMTDGAPRDGQDARRLGLRSVPAYAAARRNEARRALARAGVEPRHIHSLDFADQQLAENLVDAAARLRDIIDAWSPGMVITQPYEGGHPDHDSTAFAVHAALRLLDRADESGRLHAPALIEMTSYHAGPQEMVTGAFLNSRQDENAIHTAFLEPYEREAKRRCLECFTTQRLTLAPFLADISVERYRVAPRYNFSQPPHAGVLHYERFPWAMTAQRFSELAAAASKRLDLTGVI